MSNNKLPLENKLPRKVVSYANVLRVRRAHWVLCQVLRPLVILENRNARRTKPRKNEIPHMPQEHRLRNGVCQCYILGLRGREGDAFPGSQKPALTYARTHYSTI